tara:strand:- start:360 stop:521 length:162 start_codon:yes stop_codon:yes gene_type:complete
MEDKQKTLNLLIRLAGNIGIGKTTFIKTILKQFQWILFYKIKYNLIKRIKVVN